jgi:hypothetical protein
MVYKNPNYLKEWQEKNRNKQNKKCREYYKKNKILFKKYREDHKAQYQQLKKEWDKKNRAHIRKYIKKYMNSNPSFKIKHLLSNRIRDALKNNSKSLTTEKLLGAPIEKVKKHLEKGFPKGKGWDNYGYYGYHIDHIKPLSSFDLSDFNQQCNAFHYTNLQLLWWKDNLLKGDKYNE